eukprot:72846_1
MVWDKTQQAVDVKEGPAVQREVTKISEVHLDGLTLLKIVKHCSDALPKMVAGSLLGLDQENVLEVTHSFPLPSTKKDSNEAGPMMGPGDMVTAGGLVSVPGPDGQDFQMEMMKMLREVNVDNNGVGWYQSMYLGSFCSQTLIDNQYSYQANLSSNSVVILYDPVQTARGELTIKAYRLTDEFMRVYANKHNETISPSNVMEEIPIKIRNPGIVTALLVDLVGSSSTSADKDHLVEDCDFERLDLNTQPYLEKNLEFLCTWIDDLASEQWKFQNYSRNLQRQKHDRARWMDRQRRANEERRINGEAPLPDDDKDLPPGERKIDAPNRMESLLISTQISSYCNQLSKFTGASFERLFLASSLQAESSKPATTVSSSV